MRIPKKWPESLKLYPFERFSWKIKHLDLCPTWKCDARCPTCNAWKRGDQELSHMQMAQICDYFKDLKQIVIEGGEPTKWGSLISFVYFIKCNNITIISNGLNIENIIDKAGNIKISTGIKKVKWLISLNGIGKVHDESRGIKGAFEKTAITIMELKKLGFEVSISYVPFVENYEEYWKVKGFAKEGGHGFCICYPVQAAKFGDQGQRWTMLPEDKIIELMEDYCETSRFFNKWAYRKFIKGVKDKKILPCWAGKNMVHINPDGKIRPCPFYEKMNIGVVWDEGIKIWDFARKELQKKIIPQNCQYSSGRLCNDCNIYYTMRHKLL